MGAHARLSASAAHRWLKCAGSVNAPGKNTPSIHAATGIFAHDIAAKCLNDSSLSPTDFFLKREKVDGFDVECDMEMVDAIRLYLDEINAYQQPGDLIWVEMPLLKVLQKIDRDLGGTADCVIYRPSTRTLRVYDFKYGSGVYVDSVDNEQMKLYALGAMLEVGQPVVNVEVVICQPRFEGAKPVREWPFRGVDILDFVADVKDAAIRSRDPNPPFNAGDHCKFCPAAKSCPELERRHHALVAAEFAVPVEVAPERLAAALRDIPLVKERIKAIEEEAYKRALGGVEIPGFKIVDKRPTRKWKNEGEVIMWAQAQAIDPYAPREVISPAQMEKKLAENAPKGKKKEAGKVLEPFIEKVSSGTALVPVSDERQPAKLVTAADFEALT